MKEIGKFFRQPFRNFTDNLRTLWLHDTDQKTLDHTREAFIPTWQWIHSCIEMGMFTQERLDEISTNADVQEEFRHILNEAKSFSSKKNQEVKITLERLPADYIAAFFLYQLNDFEQRHDIKLISREEDFS